MLAGRWWKCTYDQIHDDNRTAAQSAKLSKSVFVVFVYISFASEVLFALQRQAGGGQ
jgi:hypothetical protein